MPSRSHGDLPRRVSEVKSKVLPALKCGSFPAGLAGVRSPGRRPPVMRPPYNGPSPAIADRADFGVPRGNVLGPRRGGCVSRGSPRGECLQPHGSILPGTARFAVSVSLFQHPGAFFPPPPLKRRGFQKEGIGESECFPGAEKVGALTHGVSAGRSDRGGQSRRASSSAPR